MAGVRKVVVADVAVAVVVVVEPVTLQDQELVLGIVRGVEGSPVTKGLQDPVLSGMEKVCLVELDIGLQMVCQHSEVYGCRSPAVVEL